MKRLRTPRFLLCAAFLLLFRTDAMAARAELIYDENLVQKTDLSYFGGSEYLPAKSVAAMFKGTTRWYPIAGKVTLQLHNQKITFSIDSKTAVIGDRKVSAGGTARLVRGTVWVPLRFFLSSDFAEVTDCKIRWDASVPALIAEPNASLFSPRIYSKGPATRVVLESAFELSPEFKRKGSLLTADLPKVRIASPEDVRVKDRMIASVKLEPARRGVTLKIALRDGVTTYAWSQEKNPDRLIIEFRDPNEAGTAGTQAEQLIAAGTTSLKTDAMDAPLPPAPAGKAAAPPKTGTDAALSPRKGLAASKVRKIVVDAGHGGQDAGAVGKGGTKEKDINLMIALELARILSVEGGYDVLLTRSDDTFIPLHDRTLFANEKKADLFISIHCNASIKKTQGGFEAYFLAEEASDPHAEAAAELENAVIELEEGHSKKSHKLQELLLDMAKNEFMNESSLLCSMIVKSIDQRVAIENRGVKRANFHVLHGAQMPAVLVETAFITHPKEERQLRQRKFRSSVVDAILSAVSLYEKKLEVLQGAPRKK